MNPKTPKHTPTPWHNQGMDIRDGEETTIVSVPYGDDCDKAEANVALIVRAVNSHDELLAVLKWVFKSLQEMNSTGAVLGAFGPTIKATIAKAQEGSHGK